jgi:general secretion pathway protein H
VCCRLRPRGFTLLEVLVVIVIVGIMVSVATISIGTIGRDNQVQDEAERLQSIMNQASQEAQLQGREYGLLVDSDGYEFFIFDAKLQTWQPISDDELLTSRALPEGLLIKLKLEGRPVILKSRSERVTKEQEEEDKSTESKPINELDREAPKKKGGGLFSDKKDEVRPHVFLLSSGETSEFELRIERDGTDHVWRVWFKPETNTLEDIKSENVDANA